MLREGQAKKLSAYIGEAATYDGRPLYEALVDSARTAGCAGATVLRGLAGFGATSRKHGKRAMRMSQDLPVVVQVVDQEGRILALAELFETMITDGLVTIEDIYVMAYKTGEVVG
jgi:uncharacterized protein